MNTRRLLALLAVLGLVAGLPTATAQETAFLCGGNPDTSRTIEATDFLLEYCFDGERVHLNNPTNAVMLLERPDGSKDWRFGGYADGLAEAIIANAGASALAPGQEASFVPPTNGFTLVRRLDVQLTKDLLVFDAIFSAVGPVRVVAVPAGFADRMLEFFAEIDRAASEEFECRQRIDEGALWFLKLRDRSWCVANMTGDVAFALGRLVVELALIVPAEVLRIIDNARDWANFARTSASGTQSLVDTVADAVYRPEKGELRFGDAPAASPSWEDLRQVGVPPVCDHTGTDLVDWAHPAIPSGQGHFELQRESRFGEPTIAEFVDGSGRALTAVSASCSRGGVAWSNPVVVFDANRTYVTDSFRDGLHGSESAYPAREGLVSISAVAGGVRVTTAAEGPEDGACCPTYLVTSDLVMEQDRLVIRSSTTVRCVNAYEAATCGGATSTSSEDALPWLIVNGLGELDFDISSVADARRLLDPVLGSGQVSEARCPSGSDQIVGWSGLRLVFWNDTLQGWIYEERAPLRTSLTTPSGVRIGMSEEELARVYQGIEIGPTSLGREFFFTVAAGTMSGLIDNGEVAILKAGDACVFR